MLPVSHCLCIRKRFVLPCACCSWFHVALQVPRKIAVSIKQVPAKVAFGVKALADGDDNKDAIVSDVFPKPAA